MLIEHAYLLLLLVALCLMIFQATFRPIRVEHILFAILCGSMSMVALQNLSAASASQYQYWFALGTCATCNGVWLISRALFRGEHSIQLRHYLFAVSIAILVFTNRSVDLVLSLSLFEPNQLAWLQGLLGETTTLLSSTVLAMAFWESLRGFSGCSPAQKGQRVLFASAFFIGISSCTIVGRGILTEAQSQAALPWLIVSSALTIIICTFVIIVWQYRQRAAANKVHDPKQHQTEHTVKFTSSANDSLDQALFDHLERLMKTEQMYLQHELKMIDVANSLEVSEYKVGRLIREHSLQANFNQYINHHRIQHAKKLLTDPSCKHWPVLVVSLESGFASLAPFNRAFKYEQNCTPNQYRQRYFENMLDQPDLA